VSKKHGNKDSKQDGIGLGRRWFSGFSAAAPPKRRMDGLEPPVWNAERQKGWLADKSAAIS
jgi:hypothetical protein